MSTTRTEVFEALIDERAYQESQKNDDGTWRDGKEVEQTPADFARYQQIYMGKFEQAVHDKDIRAQMDNMRKSTALGVACMETFGVVRRGVESGADVDVWNDGSGAK